MSINTYIGRYYDYYKNMIVPHGVMFIVRLDGNCFSDMTNKNKPELIKSTQSIYNAWTIEGRMPSYHHAAQEKLKRDWPTLYYAIQQLIQSYEKST